MGCYYRDIARLVRYGIKWDILLDLDSKDIFLVRGNGLGDDQLLGDSCRVANYAKSGVLDLAIHLGIFANMLAFERLLHDAKGRHSWTERLIMEKRRRDTYLIF